MGKRNQNSDLSTKNFVAGHQLLNDHPIFKSLLSHAHLIRRSDNACPHHGFGVITSTGDIHVHSTRRLTPPEWSYVIAHQLLHLAMGHFQEKYHAYLWNMACCASVTRFLKSLKVGRRPNEMADLDFGTTEEEVIYKRLVNGDLPPELRFLSTAGESGLDMVFKPPTLPPSRRKNWQEIFARGLSKAVMQTVDHAAGYEPTPEAAKKKNTQAQKARRWFVDYYPLLGALASDFTILEDPLLCYRMNIRVAAVCVETREIYINPAADLSTHELRFIIAHELLHVALRHQQRRQGRDPFLWNVACDYVINGWLMDMDIGAAPAIGVLYDPELSTLSAESIYDRIATDMRMYRKLATLRGVGVSDLLDNPTPCWWSMSKGIDLDEFYRGCLAQGLEQHRASGRGLLPGGLVEEIMAQLQPPIPWDVKLARWFDQFFPPLEKRRTYARQSRRQSSTPDIPRPRWMTPDELRAGRTFGVVLDTSGSMDRVLLAKALGAIASYSLSREVERVRVIFCDAYPHDEGYMAAEDIAGRVRIKGRGGTVLQPGIDKLSQAKDFPTKGPILIITDGDCDKLTIPRDHAFLIPRGHHLPFVPRGPVFYLQ